MTGFTSRISLEYTTHILGCLMLCIPYLIIYPPFILTHTEQLQTKIHKFTLYNRKC